MVGEEHFLVPLAYSVASLLASYYSQIKLKDKATNCPSREDFQPVVPAGYGIMVACREFTIVVTSELIVTIHFHS